MNREQLDAIDTLARDGTVHVTLGNDSSVIATLTDDETGAKARYRILGDGTRFRLSLGVID